MQYFLLTQLSRITSVTCDLRALLQNQLTGFLNTGNYMFHIIQKKFNYYQPIQMMIKMADSEVSSELYSNLFHQNGLISSVNECVCSIDVNSKLKCALDEISSLNQIIQLLLNDLNSDCAPASSDIDLSTLREIASMEKGHNVSTCDDWIEVTSKFSSNTNTVRNPDSLLAYQPIPTYNKYAHLINLQDSTET